MPHTSLQLRRIAPSTEHCGLFRLSWLVMVGRTIIVMFDSEAEVSIDREISVISSPNPKD